jgi:biopolymer transport protein ExbB
MVRVQKLLAGGLSRRLAWVLTIALIAVLYAGTGAFAQDGGAAPAGGAPANAEGGKPLPNGLFQIILWNIDFVFIVIGLCSVIGVTLIIQGIIKTRKSVYMPDESIETMRDMIQKKQFKELLDYAEQDPSFVAKALAPALKRAPSFSSMKEAMETAIGEQTAERFRAIEYLNIMGNLGPLLGLLGTVLGMIDAFSDMAKAGGDVNPTVLAAGISKALAHTFLGLFLAVPCLAAFGVLRTFVDRLCTQSALVAEELLLMIKPQEAKPAATAALGAPAAARPAVAAAAPAPRKVAPPPTPPVQA